MISIFTKLASLITRREGRKFLNLSSTSKSNDFKPNLNPALQTSLYIHIPFCKNLCPFCCFNRYIFKEETARHYFTMLHKELELYVDMGFHFTDFYFGGGTPTILMDELIKFIVYLRNQFTVKRISLETTPNELTREAIKQLKEAGINRLSIGIQTFDDNLIKSMGRIQCTGTEALERVLMALGVFDTVNIDLVYNFPSQTIEQLVNDINVFKNNNIDQVTFYPLMPSPHKKELIEKKFNDIDSSKESNFYRIILSEIYDKGYHPSTAWCFSKGTRMIDEYIIDFDDYIGIGAGSVSMYNNFFHVNTFSIQKYSDMINRGHLPIIGFRKLSRRENIYYYLLTKLFGIKFDITGFQKRFGVNIEEELWKEINIMKLLNIIKFQNSNIEVTRQGMYPISVMMRDFFSSLNTLREVFISKQM